MAGPLPRHSWMLNDLPEAEKGADGMDPIYHYYRSSSLSISCDNSPPAGSQTATTDRLADSSLFLRAYSSGSPWNFAPRSQSAPPRAAGSSSRPLRVDPHVLALLQDILSQPLVGTHLSGGTVSRLPILRTGMRICQVHAALVNGWDAEAKRRLQPHTN